MPTPLRYGSPAGKVEWEQLRETLLQCFLFPPGRWDTYVERMGKENFRRVSRQGRIVGGLGIYFMGQWFGGRSVPTGGIAAVGVPPEARSSGAAFELMAGTLRELRAKGIPLSTLYPATQRLYRKVGYEQAGSRCQFVLPARAIGRGEHELPVHPLKGEDHPLLQGPYREQARKSSGHLDRSKGMWLRLVAPTDEPAHVYLLGAREDPEAYVVYTQERRDTGYDLHLRDMVALTPRGGRALWTFLSDHRSLAQSVYWIGPTNEPLQALLPEQDARVVSCDRWFLRIVDVAKALEARGYPEGAKGALALEVTDEILPENEKRFLLNVSEGQGTVQTERSGAGVRIHTGARSAGRSATHPVAPPKGRTGKKGIPPQDGTIRMHVRGLAPLYSGYFTPVQLASLGWIEGNAAALATAARIFCGPEPWMPDGF